MEKKCIVFTGGGTAGHVIVNLALIPYFRENGWDIHYIGSQDGIEKQLLATEKGVTYHPIATGKLRRYLSLENFKDPFKVVKGIYDAWKILRKLRPQVIFSKGGFVSVPVVMAAWMLRMPTIIHESDLTPGLANKISIPFVDQVLTTFPDTIKHLRTDKALHIGAIVRDELFDGHIEEGYALTKLKRNKKTILVIGGSIGSQKINEFIRSHLDDLLNTYQIIHICGHNHIDHTIDRKGYIQFEYVQEELKHIFAITDYVISRAGANAIFEFVALKKPMLLIPLSLQASRGDQIQNAYSFKKHGLAYILEEEKLSKELFFEKLNKLNKNEQLIVNNMEQFIQTNSREKAIELIEKLKDS